MKQDETQQQTNSETLEEQKTNSWTPVGPTKDRSSGPSQLNWKLYAGGIITHWWAIKEVCKVVNRELVNHQACSLSRIPKQLNKQTNFISLRCMKTCKTWDAIINVNKYFMAASWEQKRERKTHTHTHTHKHTKQNNNKNNNNNNNNKKKQQQQQQKKKKNNPTYKHANTQFDVALKTTFS